MTRGATGLVLAVLVACGGSAPPAPSSAPTSAPPSPPGVGEKSTVPLRVEGNRPFVDLTFRKADGSTRSARFLVDTGGGGFLLVEPLAKELGVSIGATISEEGEKFARVTSELPVSIGAVALELDPERVLVMVGKINMLPSVAPGKAEGLLPGHVLARYHVVFDYPRGTFTIARPGALASEGKSLPMPVATDSGFPRTEIEVAGKTYGMLLDTGASFTMVSQSVLEAWGKAHPDWKRAKGAVGEAATLGGQTLETMFVPDASWGGHAIVELGVTSQQTGVFEKWMSSMMTAPIVGALGGNVLKKFRVDLDFPNQKLYLSGG